MLQALTARATLHTLRPPSPQPRLLTQKSTLWTRLLRTGILPSLLVMEILK